MDWSIYTVDDAFEDLSNGLLIGVKLTGGGGKIEIDLCEVHTVRFRQEPFEQFVTEVNWKPWGFRGTGWTELRLVNTIDIKANPVLVVCTVTIVLEVVVHNTMNIV